MENGYLPTRLELLPEDHRQELQKLRQGRNPQEYHVGGHQALLPGFLLVIVTLAFLFILAMLERTQTPSGMVSVDLLANGIGEFVLYVILAIALAMLFVFLIIEICRVWGRCEYFNTSFGLVKARGRQLEILDYEKILSAGLTNKTIKDPDRKYGTTSAGSIMTIKLESGRNVDFDFSKRSLAGHFLDGVKERSGKRGADLTCVKPASSLPSWAAVIIYTGISLAFGLIVVKTLFIPAHNMLVRERIENNIFEMRSGERVLTDVKEALRDYLDYIPDGAARGEVEIHYKKVMLDRIRRKAMALVCAKDSEYMRNSRMYEYRVAIEEYNNFFKEPVRQDELEVLFFHRYNEWLALIRKQGLFDKSAERQTIVELRDQVVASKVHWNELISLLYFYRVYFDDSEFKSEEDILSSSQGFEAWKSAFMPASATAEAEK